MQANHILEYQTLANSAEVYSGGNVHIFVNHVEGMAKYWHCKFDLKPYSNIYALRLGSLIHNALALNVII